MLKADYLYYNKLLSRIKNQYKTFTVAMFGNSPYVRFDIIFKTHMVTMYHFEEALVYFYFWKYNFFIKKKKQLVSCPPNMR